MPKTKAPQPHTYGYVRVSTRKQQLSPQAQEARIRALAALQGDELAGIHTDRESAKEGSMRSRPALQAILDLARRGECNRIIVAKLDRLTRSVMDLGQILKLLDKHDVSLASATESWMDTGSAAGRMILNIITAVAQWEREAIGERTREVLRYRREHGQVYCSEVPYGMRFAGKPRAGRKFAGMTLQPVEAEQRTIKSMRKWRTAGYSLRAIADKLNAGRVPTKHKGAQWYASTVRAILAA